MKTLLFWKDCWRFTPPQDAYWVECPASEAMEKIVPLLGDSKEWRDRKESYLSTTFATANPSLGLQADCYYFLVSKDGTEAIPTAPYYPYSGQWNAYCPFEEIKPFSFGSLEELKKVT